MIPVFSLGVREWRSSGKRFIADEIISGAMKVVAARFQSQIHGATGIAARFGCGLRLHRKLVDGVDRKHDAGDSRNSALVCSWDVVPQVVVVHAVDLPVDLIRAGAIHGAESSGRIT